MRSGHIIGAALIVLALGATDDAEARGRGGRTGSRGGSPGVVLVSTAGAAGAATLVQGSDHAAREPALRPVKPVTAPGALQREVRAAAPWCANQRVVGSGTGFCVIN